MNRIIPLHLPMIMMQSSLVNKELIIKICILLDKIFIVYRTAGGQKKFRALNIRSS